MSRPRLGINTCFAVKRWPEPHRWAEIVRDRLGLDLVQHSFDLVDSALDPRLLSSQAGTVHGACAAAGLELHSTFTGLAAYSYNMLLHPELAVRDAAEEWFGRAIRFTAEAGGRATGGHIGAYSAASWDSAATREMLDVELRARLGRLTVEARKAGLDAFLIENMAAFREPATMPAIERLLTGGDAQHAPISLCLDVGHQCVAGTSGDERDPYAWLRRFGMEAPVIHLQQSDERADHHWPFTPEYNAQGRIEADRVLEALHGTAGDAPALILEIIPPFEATDESVLHDLEVSVTYWKGALAVDSG